MKNCLHGTTLRGAAPLFCRQIGRLALFLVIAAAQVGRLEAAAVPALPTVEREIPAGEREAWRSVIGWPADCEDSFRSTIGNQKSGIVFHDAGDGYKLAQISCAPGAYQGYYVFAAIHGSGATMKSTLLDFPLFHSPDGKRLERSSGPEVWGTVTFDPASRKLVVLNRFRGPGDCGSYVVYRFCDGRPLVDRATGKARCDGESAGQPERWPRIQ